MGIEMDLVLEAITSKFFDFSGRARRKEYWLFVVFMIVLSLIGTILDISFGTFNEEIGMGTFGLIITVAILIPGTAVAVRRLHDTNKSGWLYLLLLIPLVGAIALIVFFCTKGTEGSNKFGDDPLSLPS